MNARWSRSSELVAAAVAAAVAIAVATLADALMVVGYSCHQ